MLKLLLVRTVGLSASYPWRTLGLALLLTVAAGWYAVRHFAINTDLNNLISSNIPWRQNEIAYFRDFPQDGDLIVAVVDAPTAEKAESAAGRLAASLAHGAPNVTSAAEPSATRFFRRNGLLFLPDDELTATLNQLKNASPLLAPVAADPSLRGIAEAISSSVRAAQTGAASSDASLPQFDALSSTIEAVLAGKPASFSWRGLFSGGGPAATPQTRQFVEIYPVLDYDELEPGAKATETIRKAVSDLHLGDDVTVRLTGSVRISDEEFGTISQGAALNGALTLAAVVLILWLALYSARIIIAVVLSLIAGLAITAALGLMMVGAFNPISVAFFVLFVGMGVDFGLQFSVSYRAERYERDDLFEALVATASGTGGRLALAALATAAGFLSFLPTAYSGLSELGEIAGAGMIIAFLTSVTVLPALLKLLNPPAEPDGLGYKALAPVDRFLERNRFAVLYGTVGVAVLGLPLLYWLSFDFNPMNLRSSRVESVATYLDLRKDPETRGGNAEVIAPSLAEADAVAARMSALAEVSRAMTLSSFVPAAQEHKGDLIREAAAGLTSLLSPQSVKAAPPEEENRQALSAASTSLAALAKRARGPQARTGQRLAAALSDLARSTPAQLILAEAIFIEPLKLTLDSVRASLNPDRIAVQTLPADLIRDWQTPDGRSRASISPKEDTSDNEALRRFVTAVLSVDATATGEPIGLVRSGDTIVNAFIQAAVLAVLSIAALLWIALRRLSDVVLTLFPLLLAAVVTLELCVVLGLRLNFANIIALPVLLGIGVAFKIYYIMAWREGRSNLLESPLTRAVFFSGLTTATAFGSLWLSNHPGTASMGQLLALSLLNTMAAAVLFQPLLMGPPRGAAKDTTKTAPKAKAAEKLWMRKPGASHAGRTVRR